MRMLLSIGAAALCLLGNVNGHGFLDSLTVDHAEGPTKIRIRDAPADYPGSCTPGEKACMGPCHSKKSWSSLDWQPTTLERGQEVKVNWVRGNHPGGFVRVAMAPLDQSDDWSAFDANILGGSCWESHCTADDSKNNRDYWGPLTGSGNAMCFTTVKVPDYFPDGEYTLQMAWHGGGIVYGEKDTAFHDFYTCSDFIIKGGSGVSKDHPAPVFVGGDPMEPNGSDCRYWKFDDLRMSPASANHTAAWGVQPTRGLPKWASGGASKGDGNGTSTAPANNPSATEGGNSTNNPTTPGDDNNTNNPATPGDGNNTNNPSNPEKCRPKGAASQA
ncbi:hypothetical protein IWQ62_002587 [Dispira parvispora]|uniref:Uncharacterized protein n=1 Tax=Dispira parvispora TaxID=1520584 RepID=A0A9W8AQ38_9FUNG|nr:hypothetical protein IWQ62_002587 [Dispira parvispora]